MEKDELVAQEEIEAEQRWEALFAASQDFLDEWADRVLADAIERGWVPEGGE